MSVTSSLRRGQELHARHYLRRLGMLEAGYEGGLGESVDAVSCADEIWGQVRHAQDWAMTNWRDDEAPAKGN